MVTFGDKSRTEETMMLDETRRELDNVRVLQPEDQHQRSQAENQESHNFAEYEDAIRSSSNLKGAS